MTIAQKIGALNANLESATRKNEFISLARAVALSRGQHTLAKSLAAEWGLSCTVQDALAGPQIYAKAAAAAGNTTDASWAGPLAAYNVLTSAFLPSLKSFGAYFAVHPFTNVVPLRTRWGAVTGGASASVIAQGNVKPVTAFTLTGGVVDELKTIAMIILTQELARVTDGSWFTNELSSSIAVKTDEQFASIVTSGVTSISSSGPTAEGARNDLRILLAAITTSVRSRLFLLVTPAVAKTWAVMHTSAGDAAFPGLTVNGGSISGITVLPSDGIAAGTVILLDASQIASALSTIQLDSSEQATVQLDTIGDSPVVAGTLQRSLWQNDEIALRAEVFWGATKMTSTGVAVLSNVAYSGDSPAYGRCEMPEYQPTIEELNAAQRLGVSVRFADLGYTLPQLIEIIADLTARVEALEGKKRKPWLK